MPAVLENAVDSLGPIEGTVSPSRPMMPARDMGGRLRSVWQPAVGRKNLIRRFRLLQSGARTSS